MKKILIFTSLFFLSCSQNDKDRISIVEEALEVDLPSNYKIEHSSEIGIGNSLDIIDITLEENDFKNLLKKIDTSKFKKEGMFYYKNIEGEGDDITRVVIFTKEYRIKYSAKD